MDIKKGDCVKIGKVRYDVLSVIDEIDKYDTEKNELVGKHREIELHQVGDPSLHTTHILKVYYDNNKEAFLLRVEHEKPQRVGKSKQKVIVFSYHDKKTIPIADIKIETKR